jgi:hypothetical protein
MSEKLYNNFVAKYFAAEDIYKVNSLKPTEQRVSKKIIYFSKFSPQWSQPIPLLVSGQGMMYGGEKIMLLQQAEKIVYFATEVYKKNGSK